MTHSFFDALDHDSNGVLQREELADAMARIKCFGSTPEEMELLEELAYIACQAEVGPI